MANGLEMMLSTEVELLQAENARLNNEVVKLREELALSRDLRRSQAQVNGDLSEQLAKEQNKLEMAEAVIAGDGALITGLKNELAAAQATIVEMREALTEVVDADECQDADGWLCFELSAEAYHRADAALALPTNQDALHEALARELEEQADWFENRIKNGSGGPYDAEWVILRKEAATHRARKQATKEECK